MSKLKHFELWMATTPAGIWLSKVLASRIDPWLYRKSGGRFTSLGPVVIPFLVLTTRGRKSGQQRDVQLVYTDLDGSIYIVASNFGGERHPAWSYNLEADADAEMDLDGDRIPIRAVRLDDDEKESVWARLCDNIPNYARYRETTDRNIKVYRLDPREQPATA